jgi:hypothetical protein
MSHSFDENEFRLWNGFRRCSPAADIAHTVREAVDDEGGNLKMP